MNKVNLGVKYNIIQAPMAGVSTPSMAAAITNLGGIGSLAMAAVDLTKGVEKFQETIDCFSRLVHAKNQQRNVNFNFFCHDITEQAKEPTLEQKNNWKQLFSKAFGEDVSYVKFTKSNVSFNEIESLHSDTYDRVMHIMTQFKPKIVSFHFGIPSAATIEKLQQNGSNVFVTVTSPQDAQKALNFGVNGLVCQGYEAGGHRGIFQNNDFDEKLSTYNLVKLVKQLAPDTYIVAAGGIMNAQDISNFFNIGASAVQLGTAFLDTKEALTKGYISQHIKKLKMDHLSTGAHTATTMTCLISGKIARCIRTPFITKVEANYHGVPLPSYGYSYSAYKQALAHSGNAEFGFHLAGQGYPFIKGNQVPVEQVFHELVQDYQDPVSR